VYYLVAALALAAAAIAAHLAARERMLARARAACGQMGVQLLDDTVVQRRVRPARTPAGRLCLRREFRFEFSTTGTDRRAGDAVLLGGRVQMLRLDLPDGAVILSGHHRFEHLQ